MPRGASEGLPEPPRGSPHQRTDRHVAFGFAVGDVVRRRRKSPLLCPANQALSARVFVKVVELLSPKWLGFDRFGMSRRLPEATLAVGGRLRAKRFGETCWKPPAAGVAELPARELAKIGERGEQPRCVEVGIERDRVPVRRHQDERVDAQILLL